MSKSYSKTRVLVECALMVAIGTVLANIKIFTMPNGGSVTIAPPSGELIYDGSAKAARLTKTGWTAADVGEIVYQKDGSALSAVPVDAGTYTAGITVGGQTASVTYEIGKATPMAKDFVFAAPGNLNYDGNSKIVTVSSTKISVDDVTVKYYQGDKQVENPTNAGDYTVKIDVAESTNYAAVNDLMADGWKFTIAKNTTTPDVTLSGDMVYKKQQIQPTVTVKIGNTTLEKDKDYTVTYGENKNAGKSAGTVTITAKGNYDFAQIVKMFDITAQIIQVTAENKSSRVGQDIVELTYTHADGLPYEGDTFSGKLETTADKDKAGTYGITKGTLTLGSNYNIVFTPGTYTVEDKLPQDSFAFKDVVDGKVTKTYGDADFTVAATDEAEGSSVSYESTNTNVATVDSTGKVTTPTDTRTKRQKGKDYPLAEVSGLKKGWAEQADAFGSWLEGKTPDEVKKLKTDADGKPTEADLLSGCTIAVDRYRDAVVRACENAQVLGAARGDTVKLGVEVAEMPQGLAGTDDKDAQVQAKITLAVVTMDENARVTSAIGDMTEPELSVSADGTVSAPREPVYTKNELGDRYGMRSASALGKEWYEHSAGWCGYLKGKNAVEIGKLSTDGTDADLKALCTISVTDLQKAALKAMAEQ